MKNSSNKKDATPEEYDVLPDDLLQVIAHLKGRVAPEKGVPVATSILYPVSTAIAAEACRKEEALRKAAEEIIATINSNGNSSTFLGQEIHGHGIFIGTWQPAGLRKKFNVFAAQEDLSKETYTYNDTVDRIAELKEWHGFNGAHYKTDKEFRKALKDGSYIKDGSDWFIPPRELLIGKDVDGGKVQPDNLYAHKDKGALRGSFNMESEKGSNFPSFYWSSTRHRNCSSDIWGVAFSTGYECGSLKDRRRLSCRPIRLEEARLELVR